MKKQEHFLNSRSGRAANGHNFLTLVPNAMISGSPMQGLQAMVAPLSSICVIFVIVNYSLAGTM